MSEAVGIAGRLRDARRAARLTQVQLAGRVGVHPSTLANWELGRIEPTVRHVKAAADALGQSFAWLAVGEGRMRKAV